MEANSALSAWQRAIMAVVPVMALASRALPPARQPGRPRARRAAA